MRAEAVPAMIARTGRKNIEEANKFAIVHMVQCGMKQIDVAIHFSIAKSTVSTIMKKFRDGSGQVKRKRRQSSSEMQLQ